MAQKQAIKRAKPRKDPAAFNKLIDGLFELDRKHPYIGQTVEPPAATPAPKSRKQP